MSYAVTDIITHATNGDPILVALSPASIAANTSFVLQIGGQAIQLCAAFDTRSGQSYTAGQLTTATNGNTDVTTTVTTNISSIDLGTMFTANQVLESLSLRNGIASGAIIGSAGTVNLSKMIVNQ